jgi:LacI family transcriptional regulator
MKGPATLHDVAARAGVSVATASRALTRREVGKRNKNHTRVLKAAAELGYVANEAARSLRNVKSMTVGVVFNQLHDPLSTELLDALASSLEEHGYSLFVATAQGIEERFDNLVFRFLERRVDALFCVNPAGEGEALARYATASIPVICLFSKSGGYEDLPLIASSIGAAVSASIAHLQTLGHQVLGVLRPDRRSRPIETFREIARKAGMTVRSYEIPEGPLDAVGILNSMVNEVQRPTVLVARQTDAMRLFESADAMSILVPRALSIIAIRDRTQQMPNTRLPMSMIHLNPGRVGVEAAAVLVKHLQGETAFSGNLAVEAGAWVEGATVGSAGPTAPAKAR